MEIARLFIRLERAALQKQNNESERVSGGARSHLLHGFGFDLLQFQEFGGNILCVRVGDPTQHLSTALSP